MSLFSSVKSCSMGPPEQSYACLLGSCVQAMFQVSMDRVCSRSAVNVLEHFISILRKHPSWPPRRARLLPLHSLPIHFGMQTLVTQFQTLLAVFVTTFEFKQLWLFTSIPIAVSPMKRHLLQDCQPTKEFLVDEPHFLLPIHLLECFQGCWMVGARKRSEAVKSGGKSQGRKTRKREGGTLPLLGPPRRLSWVAYASLP